MDREQEEMQFLGLFGIYAEAYKVVFRWRKIFSKITLSLILPLSFIFLAHIELSHLLKIKVIHTENQLHRAQSEPQKSKKLTDLNWYNITYLTFLLIFSLLSTAAVVYTIACIYTGREITFKKVMSVVPKLACVVSVLEDSYGIKAMMKSQELIKGKMLISIVIFFKLNLSLAAIQLLFYAHVVHGGWRFGVLHRLGLGMLCLLLLFKLILFGLVIQTIVYFVCKSYHHENIEKSALSDHLEAYLGEYVPLKSKDVQLEQYEYDA
ncbi:uncharacterized protein LOC113750809 [Coffea eugenioides]|uniref:uncharacterized protein LOC113750809 n=1 Tax=Coffea eugenioides TaxID=49369 RepID=UPI000F60B6F4|nr:uncharacterized protein LOC113750809 [Coffea eugenioides]